MIKIGILAMQRKESIDFLIEQLRLFTVNEYKLLIACDSQMIYEYCKEKGYPCVGGRKRVGYAKNRNRLHKWFSEGSAEHFFKFDDDCYPIQKGWDQWMIDAHIETSFPYFLMAAECGMYGKTKGIIRFKNYTVKLRELDGSMVVSMQPIIIEKIGGLNTAFGKYGGESSEFSNRVKRSGMIPLRGISLEGMDKWFWSPHIDEYIKLGQRGALTDWPEKQAEAEYATEMFPRIANASPIYQLMITE